MSGQEALAKYKAMAESIEKTSGNPAKAKPNAKNKTANRELPLFVAKLTKLVEGGQLTKQEATDLYNAVQKDVGKQWRKQKGTSQGRKRE